MGGHGCHIILGVVVIPAGWQRRAVAFVLSMGGGDYGHNAETNSRVAPAWVRESLGEHYFRSAIGISLSDTPVSDAGLVHLKGMKKLQRLYLGDTPVSDAGAVHLKGLTGMQCLDLIGAQVRDTGLAELRAAELPNCGALTAEGKREHKF
jgi:hypothetical protein